VLGDANFIKRLVEFDKDNVPERVAKAIKRIISDPTFTPDQVTTWLLLLLLGGFRHTALYTFYCTCHRHMSQQARLCCKADALGANTATPQTPPSAFCVYPSIALNARHAASVYYDESVAHDVEDSSHLPVSC
jgi:hypothetical protein